MIPNKRNIPPSTKVLLATTTLAGVTLLAIYLLKKAEHKRLKKFYEPPSVLDTYGLGDIIRIEPLKTPLPSGRGYRVIYVSELDSKKSAVSGIICIPDKKYLTKKRVVTWAHGTIGMGEECAPSRSTNPFIYMSWAPRMMKKGWVIAATDYFGIGTPGVARYLIGRDQAKDMLNIARAAVRMLDWESEKVETITFGHSQGGQVAVFAGNISKKYAPDLNVKAIATASPALELNALLKAEYDTAVAWAIGPEIAVAWPKVYKNLRVEDVLSDTALKNYKRIARAHILREYPEAILREKFGQRFFKKDPTTLKNWIEVFTRETPSAPTIPLLIVQSATDQIIMPATTDEFVKKAKAKGSRIDTLTLKNVDHNLTPLVAGNKIIEWIEDKFNNS